MHVHECEQRFLLEVARRLSFAVPTLDEVSQHAPAQLRLDATLAVPEHSGGPGGVEVAVVGRPARRFGRLCGERLVEEIRE